MCSWFFFCKQKTAYEMRISDWSSDVCSSDLCQRSAITVSARIRQRRKKLHYQIAVRGVDLNPVDPALPASPRGSGKGSDYLFDFRNSHGIWHDEIGRASCRERVCQYV